MTKTVGIQIVFRKLDRSGQWKDSREGNLSGSGFEPNVRIVIQAVTGHASGTRLDAIVSSTT